MRTPILALTLTVLPALAHAGTEKFDRSMAPVLAQYVQIQKALAGDTTKGVTRAAKRIAALAPKLDAESVQGKHAAHYKKMPTKIKAAATKLGKATEIEKQRAAFKELSRPMAMWATMSKPPGVNVVFCSMARGSWLQREKTISNPYYGAKMLRCGEVVAGKDKGTADGHMKHGHGGHQH